MHLRHFSVENYRSILSPVSVRGLESIEVFHGQNNAGKSNLMAALELAWKLISQPRLLQFTDRPDVLIFRIEEIGLSKRPAPHWQAVESPTRLSLTIAEPDIEAELDVQFKLDAVQVTRAKIQVSGKPWAYIPSASPARLGLPEQPFVLRDSRYLGASWDNQLLSERDRDASGEARLRYRRVEQALQRFKSELGPGSLDRYTHPSISGAPPWVELAWEDAEGHTVPFSEQGSGIQQIKDILCAVLGTAAPLVVLEEPETNLSEEAQILLLSILNEIVAKNKKQIFLTSHVYAFDGVKIRKVSRIGGETQVAPPTTVTVAATGEGLAGGALHTWTLALQRLYAQAGQPSAEFVTSTGILRLPPSIRRQMRLPELLTFSSLENGAFLAVPEHLLQQWTQEHSGEE